MFNELFEVIDPHCYSIMKDLPGAVFVRYFMTLFSEMKRESISLAIMDMILLVGSGSTTSTLSNPEPVAVSGSRPLCRTYQLLLAIGLAILRMIIYKLRLDSLLRNSKEEKS